MHLKNLPPSVRALLKAQQGVIKFTRRKSPQLENPARLKFTRQFTSLWDRLGGPLLETEFRFHPTRKWRLDYAHLARKIAIELDGGIFVQGGHVRALHYQSDCDKVNSAQMLGWRVFRLATGIITEDRVRSILIFLQQQLK